MHHYHDSEAAISDDVVADCYEEEIHENIQELVEKESPISKRRLCKKIMQTFGIARMGDRLTGYMDRFLAKEGLKRTSVGGDIFYWKDILPMGEYKTFRNRHDREPLDIAPEEASNAICKVLIDQGSLPEEELIKCAAKIFGYGAVRDNVSLAMKRGISHALSSGRAERNGDRIRMKDQL